MRLATAVIWYAQGRVSQSRAAELAEVSRAELLDALSERGGPASQETLEDLAEIHKPMLILQGEDDEYGTWKQVEAIQREAGGLVEAVAMPGCGHTPHRKQAEVALLRSSPFWYPEPRTRDT
jgi:pimeloyl-ACP methyl ester carboxylesterase